MTACTAAAAAIAVAAGPASTAAAPRVTNEALVSFVGAKKIKVGKRMTYDIVCASNCNVTVKDRLVGPGTKDSGRLSGALTAAVPVAVILKPNGPLLRGLRAFPGRFKLASTVIATNPATGETDSDTRVYRFKK